MEIHSMKQLDHPNLIKLIDAFESPDYICILLEYCQAGEFMELITQYEKVCFPPPIHLYILNPLLRCQKSWLRSTSDPW